MPIPVSIDRGTRNRENFDYTASWAQHIGLDARVHLGFAIDTPESILE